MTACTIPTTEESPFRVLIVDDNREIHQDLAKLLASQDRDDLADQEAALFGTDVPAEVDGAQITFDLTSAFQGKDALDRLVAAAQDGRPFDMAFVDMRMPPGWDGLQTIEQLWKRQPGLEIAICTAHSDYSWREVIARLGHTDRFLVLKKPFDGIEARQLACSLAMKAKLRRADEEQRRQLESAVEVRTRELSEARQVAEKANQAKSVFLANMSHELRTPLTAVLGYADLLLDAGLTDQERMSHAAAIKRAGEHLLRIINQVLDLSKIEAGQLAMEVRETFLRRLLHDLERIAAPLAKAKGIGFSIRLATPLPDRIQTDALRLSQILINLVGNAVKFTDAGCVEVVLSALQAEDESLVVDIVDTGSGIEVGQADRLFTPFTQLDMSLQRSHGGTGLGLSISRKLARLLGGDIWLVRSEPDHGSTFRLQLPLKRAAAAQDINSTDDFPLTNEVAISTPSLMQSRILLAEDSPDSQRFFVTVLTKAGADVTVVSDGREALEQLLIAANSQHPFDLLITDIQMPVVDGLTLAAEIRDRGVGVPIIALTAHAMEDDRLRCFAAGCNDYASKPISRATLISTCSRWLPKLSVTSPAVSTHL
jgi:two-component system sensor histidine kinase/response regulator